MQQWLCEHATMLDCIYFAYLVRFSQQCNEGFSLLGFYAVFKVHEDFFVDSETLKMKVTCSFKILGTTYPVSHPRTLESSVLIVVVD
jgi:hypothetical protein